MKDPELSCGGPGARRKLVEEEEHPRPGPGRNAERVRLSGSRQRRWWLGDMETALSTEHLLR